MPIAIILTFQQQYFGSVHLSLITRNIVMRDLPRNIISILR